MPAPNTPSSVDVYFDQAFSLHPPQHGYTFPALRKQCDHTNWKRRASGGDSDRGSSSSNFTAAAYLECEGIYLGLTSVISQVKSCLRMAIDAGTGVILPKIPLRDANNLLSYNQGNPAAERAFGDWFDESHLVDAMASACPGLEVVTPQDFEAGGRLEGVVAAGQAGRWEIDVHAAKFFRERDGYFWAGKPFGAFFDEQYAQLRKQHDKEKKLGEQAGEDGAEGAGETESELQRRAEEGEAEAREESRPKSAVVVGMRADFELFNVANDPTGHDRHVWDDLGRALRFPLEPRGIIDKLLRQIGGNEENQEDDKSHSPKPPYFGVHFRGEGDNMWASAAEQIHLDLDALDQAWELYQNSTEFVSSGSSAKRPPVYLACGDEGSLNAFVEAGRARGWEVTSKYALAKAMEKKTLERIEALPFDFQAIIDLGMLVRSHFFIGIMGSAFSYTTANLRDPLTRYRGSSFEVWDDEDARTHMFPNADRHGDATMEKYACCL